MKVLNTARQTVVSDNLVIAKTFWARLVGLLDRSTLPEGEGLFISSCQGIHMFFMKFPIDVIFINKDKTVVGIVENIKPFEMSPMFWKASDAIELPAGTVQKSRTVLGDVLEIK